MLGSSSDTSGRRSRRALKRLHGLSIPVDHLNGHPAGGLLPFPRKPHCARLLQDAASGVSSTHHDPARRLPLFVQPGSGIALGGGLLLLDLASLTLGLED
jgi:hypothetical protein